MISRSVSTRNSGTTLPIRGKSSSLRACVMSSRPKRNAASGLSREMYSMIWPRSASAVRDRLLGSPLIDVLLPFIERHDFAARDFVQTLAHSGDEFDVLANLLQCSALGQFLNRLKHDLFRRQWQARASAGPNVLVNLTNYRVESSSGNVLLDLFIPSVRVEFDEPLAESIESLA